MTPFEEGHLVLMIKINKVGNGFLPKERSLR